VLRNPTAEIAASTPQLSLSSDDNDDDDDDERMNFNVA